MRGLTIKHKENKKSYHASNKERVTIIEVDSELYNFDTIYQDVTLDTEYENWQTNQLKTELNKLNQ